MMSNNRVAWNQLQSAPNITTAWRIVSKELGRFMSSDEGFGEEVIAVPRIEDAAHYDLMVCFSKHKRFDTSHLRWGHDFHIRGHMTEIMVVEQADHRKLLDCSKNPSDAILNKEELEFSVYSEEAEKEITITLAGLEKKVVNWRGMPRGQLILDTEKVDLEGRRILHVITEVIYADKVSVKTKVGSDSCENVMSTSGIPVAFSYTKFPVDKDGIIKEARNTTINRSRTFAPVSL